MSLPNTKTEKTYLDTFFEEKAIPYASYELEKDGILHLIDTDAAIDFIKKNDHVFDFTKQIRRMDFYNYDFTEFLRIVCCFVVEECY